LVGRWIWQTRFGSFGGTDKMTYLGQIIGEGVGVGLGREMAGMAAALA
jgi:outer membrane lipoprotein SlyB